MRYFTFKRESNNFTDILTDINIKKLIRMKLSWKNHLLIGLLENDGSEKTSSYVTIKYGDDMINGVAENDYSPKPYVDYMPEKDVRKMKKREW